MKLFNAWKAKDIEESNNAAYTLANLAEDTKPDQEATKEDDSDEDKDGDDEVD